MASVLLVDDEPDLRFLMRKLLERGGHSVIEASNGRHALRALEDHDTVDVVITDLEMPRMGGVELIAELRQRHPGATIIVWADDVRPEVHADVIFAKPYGGSEIVEAVDRLA